MVIKLAKQYSINGYISMFMTHFLTLVVELNNKKKEKILDLRWEAAKKYVPLEHKLL